MLKFTLTLTIVTMFTLTASAQNEWDFLKNVALINYWVQTVLLSGVIVLVITVFIKVHNVDKRLTKIENEMARQTRAQEQEQEQNVLVNKIVNQLGKHKHD